MTNLRFSSLLLAFTLLSGCTTRSISHSEYPGGSSYFAPRPNGSDPGFEYRGELSEFDVLGIARGQNASESEIQQALNNARPVALRRNSSILLIQSGAMFPDGGMVAELSKHFQVVPFSGMPNVSHRRFDGFVESRDPENYSRSLRLAAARGSSDVILCYWGILESGSENLATKTVSWVPVVNWILPDERQHMRIRLKLALIDVRTGNWSVLSPEPFDDSRVSTSPRRGVADQKQVELLKSKAYSAGVNELLGTHLEPLAAAKVSHSSVQGN